MKASTKPQRVRMSHALTASVAALALGLGAQAVVTPPTTSKESAVAGARAAVSTRTSIRLDRLSIVTIRPIDWRDLSIGCPQAEIGRVPRLASGYHIVLSDGEREYDVRTAAGYTVLCSVSGRSTHSSVALFEVSRQAADAVRLVIAKTAAVSPSAVQVASVRAARADTRPCADIRADDNGVIVEATAAGRTYRYYSDSQRTVNCERPAGVPR